ncbi:MAG: tetratricopeptide repeat protein [Gloeobacterales cyanobacterium]
MLKRLPLPLAICSTLFIGSLITGLPSSFAIAATADSPKVQESIPELRTVDSYLKEGLKLYQKGDIKGAELALQKAINLEPGNAALHSNLGIVLADQNRFKESIREYREAVRLSPQNPVFHNNLGNVLSRTGDLQGASVEYREAIRLNPKYALAYFNLGTALGSLREFENSNAAYKKAIVLEPKLAPAYANLGLNLFAQGKQKQSLVYLKQARDLFIEQGMIDDAETVTHIIMIIQTY